MRPGIALLALAPCALLAQSPSPCNATPAYAVCEIAFELPAGAPVDPYAIVKVDFRSPRQRTYSVPGFWDGGRRMAVRFSPVEAGEWAYRVTSSSVAGWDGQEGSFTAAPSDAPGFIKPAEMHHWAYTERNLAHLWMGVTEMSFVAMDDAAFRAMADARAAQKFNHLRGMAIADLPGVPTFIDRAPNPAYFQRLDRRVRYLNQKGIIVDLVLSPRPSSFARPPFSQPNSPGSADYRRVWRYLVARYAAMNITWELSEEFEAETGARALLKECGLAIKELDPYHHPRTSGAQITSAPLLDDGWMDFAAYGAGGDDSVGAIEHQLYAAPFVNLDLGAGADAEAVRHRLWNAFMDGQYPTYAGAVDSSGAKAMTAWYNLISSARHWELEPYFDVDGGRAVALEDADYIVYVEKPATVELQVEKHGYDVFWIDPATGETIKEKKGFSGDHFTGSPPAGAHDWVLRLLRPGRLDSLARSYRFESRSNEEESKALPVQLQDIENGAAKIPFTVDDFPQDLSLSIPAPFQVKLARQTRATRSMMWLWTAEATIGGQGYRVLSTAQQGYLKIPADIADGVPAPLVVRLYGMNANGKVYVITKPCQLNR